MKMASHILFAVLLVFTAAQPFVIAGEKPSIDQLMKDLVSEDPKIRNDALYRSDDLGAEAKPAIPLLAKMLIDDRDPDVIHAFMILDSQIMDIAPAGTQDLSRLLIEIASGNEDERTYAALALGKISGKMDYRNNRADETACALIKALEDDSPYVQGWAAHSIGTEYGPLYRCKAITNSVPELIKLLSDKRPALRREAVQTLGNIFDAPASVVPHIAKLLDDDAYDVKSAAFTTFLRWAEQRPKTVAPCLDKLITCFKTASSRDKSTIAGALGDLGRTAAPAIPALVEAMQDNDAYVRNNAAEALGKICSRYTESFYGFTDIPRIHTTNSCVELNPPEHMDIALAALITALDDKKDTEAADALGLMGRYAESALPTLEEKGMKDAANRIYNDLPVGTELDELIQNTANFNPYMRRNALAALGDLQTTNATAILQLVNALQDEEPMVVRAASESLVQIGPIVLPQLVGALKEEKEPNAQQITLETFAAIGSPANDALPAIIPFLSTNASPKVSRAACKAIANIGPSSPEAIPPLIELLGHPDKWVRNEATTALTGYGPKAKKALPILTRLLLDDINDTHTCVVDCMASIGIERDLADTISRIKLDDSNYIGHSILELLLPFPDESLYFLKNNNELLITIMGHYGGSVFSKILRLKGWKYRHLKAYMLDHKDIPPAVLAYSGEKQFLPRILAMMPDADPHKRAQLQACARVLGQEPDRIVKISKGHPGDFKPKSAWPGSDGSRMSGGGGHGDGQTVILITGRLLQENGKPAESPTLYRTNGDWLLGEEINDAVGIEYNRKTGRFFFSDSVFAAYSDGPGTEPGPYQTGSAHIVIKSDNTEPLLVQFYDEMPDVEISLPTRPDPK